MSVDANSADATKPVDATRRRLLLLVPLAVFLALTVVFFVGLGNDDPSRVPSPLIGRPAPDTNLPPILGLERDGKPLPGLSSADFKGQVTVVNVWASWCVPCREEAPLLTQLAEDPRIRVTGINYKDQPDNARRFLGVYGNPYAATGADQSGRASIEWGVYGVPETFVVDGAGQIRFKLIGPVSPDNLERVLKPEIAKAFGPMS
jgi:cytochrome c biogenesis protein CcmG, thiol:disulfide interchange protein DsbE